MLQHKRGSQSVLGAVRAWPGKWKLDAWSLGVPLPSVIRAPMGTSRWCVWSEPHPWWSSVSLSEFRNLWPSFSVQKKWMEMPSCLCHLEVKVWTNVNLFWAFQKAILLRVRHTAAFGRFRVLSHFVCTDVCPVRKGCAVGPGPGVTCGVTSLQSVRRRVMSHPAAQVDEMSEFSYVLSFILFWIWPTLWQGGCGKVEWKKNTKKSIGGKYCFWKKVIKYNLVSRWGVPPRGTPGRGFLSAFCIW